MRLNVFVSFVLCGGLAALANLASRWFFSFFTPYAAAVTLAYLVGMLSGFLLFKFVVFKSGKSEKTLKESLWYIAVNAFALLQTLGISIGLADYVFPWLKMSFHPYDIAHLVGVMFPVITSFFGHKYLTFK